MSVRQQSKTRIKGYQKNHAKKRALDRYGIELSPKDYDMLLGMILNGTAHLVKKLTNTRSIFLTPFQNRDLFSLYNNKTKRIVTFLTSEQIMEI